MSLLDMIMGKQPNPTGLTPMQQRQAMMGGPAPISTPRGENVRQPSFFERLGSGAMDYLSDPTNRARLAAGFNTMRLNPDPNIAKMAQSQIETAQAMELLKGQGNKTAEWLEKNGYAKEAALVRQNPSLAKEVFASVMGREKKETFETKTGADVGVTDDPTGLYNVSSTGKVSKVGGAGTTINMPAQVGTIPPGYEAIYDDSGRITKMEPIPGGPVATEEAQSGRSTESAYASYQAVAGMLADALGQSNFSGSILGLVPAFTSSDLTVEGLSDVMLQPLKAIFKGKGEGTFTDDDARQLISMMPTRRDTPESAAAKMKAVDVIIRAKLGLPFGDATPLSSNVTPTKVYNPVTQKIEDM